MELSLYGVVVVEMAYIWIVNSVCMFTPSMLRKSHNVFKTYRELFAVRFQKDNSDVY